jgi:two-component system chemotaxis sensor kinase CheA
MPGMDGFALAKAVRSEARISSMPIIALSAYGSPDAVERGRQVGLNDFVAKFDRQSLLAALKEQATEVNQAA